VFKETSSKTRMKRLPIIEAAGHEQWIYLEENQEVLVGLPFSNIDNR
jgi:hypothetical protein